LTLQERQLENLPPASLLSKHRLDVTVKWRYFNHLIGGKDPDSEREYRRLLSNRNGHRMAEGLTTDGWKTSLDDWVAASKALLDSIQTNGFIERHAIPIDKHGELLNGTHRLACALAVGFTTVPVWRLQDKEVWAPPWGLEWFQEQGYSYHEMEGIVSDFEAMSGKQANPG
jgi:hypothetical protein